MLRCALEEYPADCDAVEEPMEAERQKTREAERLLQIEDWHLLYPFVASDLWYIVISICSHVVDDLRSFREIVLTCIDVDVI